MRTALILLLLTACNTPATAPALPMCDTFEPAFIDEVVGRTDWADGTWLVFTLTLEVDGVSVPRGTLGLTGKRIGTTWALQPPVPCTAETYRIPGRLLPSIR